MIAEDGLEHPRAMRSCAGRASAPARRRAPRRRLSRAAAAADLLCPHADALASPPGGFTIDHPYKRYCLAAAAYSAGVPFTCHPMFGHDIIYTHPMNRGRRRSAGRPSATSSPSSTRSRALEGGRLPLRRLGRHVADDLREVPLDVAQRGAGARAGAIEDFSIHVVDLARSTWDWTRGGEPPQDDPGVLPALLQDLRAHGRPHELRERRQPLLALCPAQRVNERHGSSSRSRHRRYQDGGRHRLGPRNRTREDTAPTPRGDPGAVRDCVSSLPASWEEPGLSELCCGIARRRRPLAQTPPLLPLLGWRDVPFVRMIEAALDVPVTADNDVKACAWAEAHFGLALGYENFFWTTISTGIGGAVVEEGEGGCGQERDGWRDRSPRRESWRRACAPAATAVALRPRRQGRHGGARRCALSRTTPPPRSLDSGQTRWMQKLWRGSRVRVMNHV